VSLPDWDEAGTPNFSSDREQSSTLPAGTLASQIIEAAIKIFWKQ
jgi:hypothetical protein